MKLRDLTEEQREKFLKQCEELRVERDKGRPVNNPIEWVDFRLGFSDGVRTVLELIDKLP